MKFRDGEEEEKAWESLSKHKKSQQKLKPNELISQADKSLQFLTSFDSTEQTPVSEMELTGNNDSFATPSLNRISRKIDYSNMSLESSASSSTYQNKPETVEPSIRKGMLHVSAIFPDRTVEYIDIEPRFTTIGELKDKFCDKRNAYEAFGWEEQGGDICVIFEGRSMEDSWLVVDCGVQFDGTIYITKKPKQNFLKRLDSSERKNDNSMFSSIASVYTSQESTLQDQQDIDASNFSLSLSESLAHSKNSVAFKAAYELENSIRPEEIEFKDVLLKYDEKKLVEKSDSTEEVLETLELVNSYINILQGRIEKLHESLLDPNVPARLKVEYKELVQERNTWRLLHDLKELDLVANDDTESMLVNDYSSSFSFDMTEDEAIFELEKHNPLFRIQKCVQKWLESIATERISYTDERRIMYERTLGYLQHKKRNEHMRGEVGEDRINGINIVSSLDPDSTLREKSCELLPDDAEDEVGLLRSVWSFIRAGKIDKAVDLCIQLGQSWRAASISGYKPTGICEEPNRSNGSNDGELMDLEEKGRKNDSDGRNLVRWGNPFRVLWKETCWKFSDVDIYLSRGLSKTSLTAKEYERVIYGTLGGNVPVVLQSKLCASWEDHCWILFKSVIDRQEDELLAKLLQYKLQHTRLLPVNTESNLKRVESMLTKNGNLSMYQTDMSGIFFQELSKSSVEAVRKEAQELHHQIQARLVTSQIPTIITSLFGERICGENLSTNWDLYLHTTLPADKLHPQFLRFAAHFVLILKEMGEELEDNTSCNMVLKAYIRHLVKHSQSELIPLYVSKLPNEGCVEVYAQFLATIEETSEREISMQNAEKYFAPDLLPLITKMVVEKIIVMNQYEVQSTNALPLTKTSDLGVISSSSLVSDADYKRMNSIEYLFFDPTHRGEALYQANLLAQSFLAKGNNEAIKVLFSKILPEDSLAVIKSTQPNQTVPEGRLLQCMRAYLCWNVYLEAREFYSSWREIIGKYSEPFVVYEDEKDFFTELLYCVSKATDALNDLLQFERGWLVDCLDEQDVEKSLRGIVIPEMLLNLHCVLFDSAKLILGLQHLPMEAKNKTTLELLQHSIKLADLVSDEQLQLYKCLKRTEIQTLLHCIQQSALVMLHVDNEISL